MGETHIVESGGNHRHSLDDTMRIIPLIRGKIILFFKWAFPPRGIKRDPQRQAQIDLQTANLKLYQYQACPFCVKVRRAMKRQSLGIETRDVKRSDSAREELLGISRGGLWRVRVWLLLEGHRTDRRWI